MSDKRLQAARRSVENSNWYGRKPIAADTLQNALSAYPGHDLAVCLWQGTADAPLFAGLDWLAEMTPGEHGITVRRIIEPVYRERVETLPHDTIVMVFEGE